MGLPGFIVTIFILGFFMALGKAAVYKHIPFYYAENVGAVGGLVGLIGGLGGFFLPIAFGVALDLTGLWTSCFMLMFLIVVVSMTWMHFAVRQMEAEAAGAGARIAAGSSPNCRKSTSRNMSARCPARCWRTGVPRTGLLEKTGKAIARQNLWISIPALLLSFVVWQVWSVVVAKLPLVGFKFTTDQLFWLAALPGLSGATLRIFYSFMVPIFGGRLWTTLTTWSLIIPAIGIGYAVQSPDTPYVVLLILALLCGFGGGNFASSMANISFFYPRAEKGHALAMNAGLGNLGVSVVQFVVPLIIAYGVFGRARRRAAGGGRGRQGGPYLVAERLLHFRALHRGLGFRGVVRHERHRLGQGLLRRTIGDLHPPPQLDHVRALHRHLRLVHRLCRWLPVARQDPVPARQRAGLRLSRPAGRRPGALGHGLDRRPLRRRPGDVRRSSCGMMLGVAGVLYFVATKDQPGAFWGFFASFLFLFLMTGIGNASTFQMIPNIMRKEIARLEPHLDPAARLRQAEKELAAITGFTSAIAAYGAFFIPKSYGTALALTGGVSGALWAFLIFYAICAAITWSVYTRKGGLLHDVERGVAAAATPAE